MSKITYDEIFIECPKCGKKVVLLSDLEPDGFIYSYATGFCWPCQKTITCQIEICVENLKIEE